MVALAALTRINRLPMADLEVGSRSTAQGRSASRTEREATLMPGGPDQAQERNPALKRFSRPSLPAAWARYIARVIPGVDPRRTRRTNHRGEARGGPSQLSSG